MTVNSRSNILKVQKDVELPGGAEIFSGLQKEGLEWPPQPIAAADVRSVHPQRGQPAGFTAALLGLPEGSRRNRQLPIEYTRKALRPKSPSLRIITNDWAILSRRNSRVIFVLV